MHNKKPVSKKHSAKDPIWVDGWSAVQEYIQMQPKWIVSLEVHESVKPSDAIFQLKEKFPTKTVSSPDWQGKKSLIRALIKHPIESDKSLASLMNESLVVVFDGIEDPRNFGAIARSAAFMGVKVLVFRNRRQVSISPASLATSQGAFAHLRMIEVKNITRALQVLKKKGFWIVGATLDGEDIVQVSERFREESKAIVLGNEATGISKLVLSECDLEASIPRKSSIDSLNVSAAATVLFYELAGRHAAEIS